MAFVRLTLRDSVAMYLPRDRLSWPSRAFTSRISILLSRAWILWHWYRRVVVNWTSVLALLILPRSRVDFRFRDGDHLTCTSFSDWARFQNVTRLKLLKRFCDAEVLVPDRRVPDSSSRNRQVLSLRFMNPPVAFTFESDPSEHAYGLAEVFLMGEYSGLPVVGRDVVDIGCSVGDSSLYFVRRGARHVYAYEASPSTYTLAKFNIRLNRSDDRITLDLAACGPKEGTIKVLEGLAAPGTWAAVPQATGTTIDVVTLDQIVGKWRLAGASLKIDCEGWEYGVVSCKDETLQAFDHIVIEYHYGEQWLVDRLRAAGFVITRLSRPMRGGDGCQGRRLYLGILQASRAALKNPPSTQPVGQVDRERAVSNTAAHASEVASQGCSNAQLRALAPQDS